MSNGSSKAKSKKASRKQVISRVEETACSILRLWNETIKQAEIHEPFDSTRRHWFKREQRQAYQDLMLAMRHNGLISDYSLKTNTVTLAEDIQ